MKFLDGLNKYVTIVLYALMVMTAVNSCHSCSTQKENSKLRKEVDSLSITVKALNNSIYNKEELDVRMSIEGYEISKRMLYDQNAIVRTTVRPDDRMNEYDKKIKELQEKISSKSK